MSTFQKQGRQRPRPCQWRWVAVKQRNGRIIHVRRCVVHTITPVPPIPASTVLLASNASGNIVPVIKDPPPIGVGGAPPMCGATGVPVIGKDGQWHCVFSGGGGVPLPLINNPSSETAPPVKVKMPTMNLTMPLLGL